jgi:hypothetical protein
MISSDSPFEGVPSQIVDLSFAMTDFVERAIGIRPDFSPETLSIVDHYATIARKQVAERPEVSDLTAQGLGAYFGEVLRRSEGAFWQVPTANYHDWSLCGISAFVSVNPIGVGYDALFGSVDHKGPSPQIKLAPEDRKMVTERLDRLPAVRESEYFSLCTRFEVVQIVMEAVRAASETRGYEDMAYTEEDYRGGLGLL